MKKSICVFGDLTALYSARSKDRKPINYEILNEVILSSLEIKSFKDIEENRFYTLFSETNSKQVSFINGLSKFGWTIETMNPRDISKDVDWQNYRFDNRISFQVGLGCDKLLVLSDSFELLPVLKAAKQEDPELEINLAFFGSSLDNKWWKVLNSEDNFINFIDLDNELYEEKALD